MWRIHVDMWDERPFGRIGVGGMRHEPNTRTGGHSRPERDQLVVETAQPAVNPLLRRQITEAVHAQQRFTQRHEAILHGPPTDCGRQGLLELLAMYTSLTESLDTQCRDLVVLARRQGISWAQIAIMLGITRQAAQQRYRHACDRTAATQDEQASTP